MSAPPRLASWLLDQFLLGERRDSLIGDLTERYVKQPSSLWYWRQAMMAIVATFLAQLLAHIWLVLVVVGASLLLPKFYVRFVLDSAIAVQKIMSHAFVNWTIDAGAIWFFWFYWYVLVLIEFAPGVVFFCAGLSGLAFLLVRARPRERGLIVSVLILSCIVQASPDLVATVRGRPMALTNPVWLFKVVLYLTFVFVAVPYSILRGGRRQQGGFASRQT